MSFFCAGRDWYPPLCPTRSQWLMYVFMDINLGFSHLIWYNVCLTYAPAASGSSFIYDNKAFHINFSLTVFIGNICSIPVRWIIQCFQLLVFAVILILLLHMLETLFISQLSSNYYWTCLWWAVWKEPTQIRQLLQTLTHRLQMISESFDFAPSFIPSLCLHSRAHCGHKNFHCTNIRSNTALMSIFQRGYFEQCLCLACKASITGSSGQMKAAASSCCHHSSSDSKLKPLWPREGRAAGTFSKKYLGFQKNVDDQSAGL